MTKTQKLTEADDRVVVPSGAGGVREGKWVERSIVWWRMGTGCFVLSTM